MKLFTTVVLSIFLVQFNFSKIFAISLIEYVTGESYCERSNPIKDIAFVKLLTHKSFTYDNVKYEKTYFISRYARADWFGSKTLCKSFGLELATFETLYEAEKFIEIAKENKFVNVLNDIYFHFFTDGMTLTPNSTTDWYWTKTGKQIPYTLPWRKNEPSFQDNLEYCMSVFLYEEHNLGFNDVACQREVLPFICQRIVFFNPV